MAWYPQSKESVSVSDEIPVDLARGAKLRFPAIWDLGEVSTGSLLGCSRND